MQRERGHHEHDAVKHRHKHYYVTHYLHRGENWGHLLSTHTHDHNHAAVEHVHIPHADQDKEHRREAPCTTMRAAPNLPASAPWKGRCEVV